MLINHRIVVSEENQTSNNRSLQLLVTVLTVVNSNMGKETKIVQVFVKQLVNLVQSVEN